jgi:hypothetical protein
MLSTRPVLGVLHCGSCLEASVHADKLIAFSVAGSQLLVPSCSKLTLPAQTKTSQPKNA